MAGASVFLVDELEYESEGGLVSDGSENGC